MMMMMMARGKERGEEEERVVVVVVVGVCMSEVGMCYGAISNLGAGGAAGKDGRTTQLVLVPTCLAVLMLLGMYGWKRYDRAFIARRFLSGLCWMVCLVATCARMMKCFGMCRRVTLAMLVNSDLLPRGLFIRRSVEYLDASADRESASLEHIEATNWNTQLNGFRLQNQPKDCRKVPGKKDPGA